MIRQHIIFLTGAGISVLWGFRTKEFLLAHGATMLVEKPEEIIN